VRHRATNFCTVTKLGGGIATGSITPTSVDKSFGTLPLDLPRPNLAGSNGGTVFHGWPAPFLFSKKL